MSRHPGGLTHRRASLDRNGAGRFRSRPSARALRWPPLFYVFVANLARPAAVEADLLAPLIGRTPFEARLALAAGTPSIVLQTRDHARAIEVLGVLRARGHGAHVFDDELFVKSAAMTRLDAFQLDADGVRRLPTGELLPYGDVYAVLRAVHDKSTISERQVLPRGPVESATPAPFSVTRSEEREHVAYFFRRSGERPWLLRERHANYTGLGDGRAPVATQNFTRLVGHIRQASPTAVFDDRLVRRRVAERLSAEGIASSRDGVDLLAHLLAMTIANLGGSPYR
ncbi:MAG: hypothetical protein JWP97_1055 [Labilithrix sp.]|nr:hypothetical protein [Labilithrix sp.]